MILTIMIIIIYSLFVSSFTIVDKDTSEHDKLQKLSYRALRNTVGKIYLVDLTHKRGCNKTCVKYLGVVHTKQGKSYKILTSFFVFSAGATCHETSTIEIFDMKNRYIGEYYVSTPEGLPDMLRNNKLLYVENTEECDLRKKRSIDLSNGLPNKFFNVCSENGGDMYTFSSGD